MKITLREYQKEDFQELENIIRETWHYDEFSSSETAARLARVFLNSCLTNHTFSRVAVWNGKPVGIILCKITAGYKCPLKYRAAQIKSILSLYLSLSLIHILYTSINYIFTKLHLFLISLAQVKP